MALKQRHKVGCTTRRNMAHSLKRNTSVFEIQTRDILTLSPPANRLRLTIFPHTPVSISVSTSITYHPTHPTRQLLFVKPLKITAISLL